MTGTRLKAICALALVTLLLPAWAADTLPSQLSDAEYWKMISEFSEPYGHFQHPIVTSNEISYQSVLPALMKTARFGGVYLGVGPEQNFTYIAALQPKIAFIIDIQGNMMLEHLMYKSIFEMSPDRIAFVANLFGRRVPRQLSADTPVQTVFREFAKEPADMVLAHEHLEDILDRLKTVHHFGLASEDETTIQTIYMTFVKEGVLNFSSSFMSPGYAALMTMTDNTQKNWSYLATTENYVRVRSMHQKNLIVPLVGDFSGTKTIRMVGEYLKAHDAIVNVFYISNVEDYIQAALQNYKTNIASLPINPSSFFVRWSPGAQTSLASVSEFVRAR